MPCALGCGPGRQPRREVGGPGFCPASRYLTFGVGLSWLVDPMLILLAALGAGIASGGGVHGQDVLLRMAMEHPPRANPRPGFHSRIWGLKAPRHGIFLRLHPDCTKWRAKPPSFRRPFNAPATATWNEKR